MRREFTALISLRSQGSTTLGVRRSTLWWRPLGVALLLSALLASCADDDPKRKSSTGQSGAPADRFAAASVTSPTMGYIDSIFINASGDRVYFLHSVMSVDDFIGGTANDPQAPFLPGHQGQGTGVFWNSDLYMIEWTGSAWSTPANLGTQINSIGNECCVWLSEDETEIIFFRDTLGLPIGGSGNYAATRPSRNDPWGTPVPLPGAYGTSNQDPSTGLYRHDIHKTPSGDLYLWENNIGGSGDDELLYGHFNGTGYAAPAPIAAANSSIDETQVWVSSDERTMLLNRRDATGETALIRLTRPDTGSAWGSTATVPINGFADAAGNRVWGEPTLSASQSYMIFIRFETSTNPWQAEMMYAPGDPLTGFGPAVKLN